MHTPERFGALSQYINGQWREGQSETSQDVINPATGAVLGSLQHCSIADLDEALAASQAGFEVWRDTSARARKDLIDRTVALLRERTDKIAEIMTLEMGKPLAESKIELGFAIDTLDWYGQEGQRAYGRLIPARAPGMRSQVLKEPVGPALGFVAWNFPATNVIRKLAGSVASGCSMILKPSEETPATAMEIVQCFEDAGLPKGVVNLVFGNPAEISTHLIASPIPRKITVTGSTEVGKLLARMAADTLKRCTMELGGHAPVIIAKDADLDHAVAHLLAAKQRNAGQVCTSPTRFLIEKDVYVDFRDAFSEAYSKTVLGNGMDEGTQMGPLIADRRVDWMDKITKDAVAKGADLRTGGQRHGNVGSFYEPTVLADATTDMLGMQQEPFGPVVMMAPMEDLDAAVKEANRPEVGLASYAFTTNQSTALDLQHRINAGLVGVNNVGVSLPEAPFGGVDETGYGSEGGMEGIEAFLRTKFVNETSLG